MNYQNSLKFWSSLDSDQDTWPYETIEKNISNKLKKLIDSLNVVDTLVVDQLKKYSNFKDLTLTADSVLYKAGFMRLLKTQRPIYIIGDIHSDAVSLDALIEKIKPYENDAYLIFLGDYVDRGHAHLESLDKLYSLKLDLGNRVILLRGNHDGGQWQDDDILLPYRLDPGATDTDYFPLYLLNLHKKKQISKDFINLYFNYCDQLPYIAIVDDGHHKYMAVHGGLPRPTDADDYSHIHSLYDLVNPEVKDTYNVSILNNLFWSDPTDEDKAPLSEKRRFKTYEEHFHKFTTSFGIDHIIRGHQSVDNGHRSIYNNHLHTIFSTGNPSKASAYETVHTPKYIGIHKTSINSYPLFDKKPVKTEVKGI